MSRHKTPKAHKAHKAAPGPAITADTPCPCGLGKPYVRCCGVFHGYGAPAAAAAAPAPTAPTAELLMRSRYSAFALGNAAYLLSSWHTSTRPTRLDLDPAQRWQRLEILGTTEGGPFHAEGTVEFRAHFSEHGHPDVLQENSRFVRSGGAWVYLDAIEPPVTPPAGQRP